MTATATDAPPLSVAQEALWYASVLDPRRLSYHETVSLRKDGPLDVDALRRAFAELVRRHAPWRTTFATQDGGTVQVVHPPAAVELPVVDLSALPRADAEARAARLVAERARVPFDLRRGPLVRPRLVRFGADHHRLYLTLHHIVFDGVSLYRVVLPELVALYDAFRRGEPSPLADLPAAYGDYARWEQDWIEGPRARRRLRFWQDRLAGAPDLAFPHDRPRAQAPRFRGGVVEVSVPAGVVDGLRAAGHGAGASLFQVLAAAWGLLLARWADQDDVVFATPADLRREEAFEGLVGYCLTPLPLRLDLAGDPSFAEVVVRARNALLDAYDQVVPFERVVRELPASPGGANPVYQAMLVLEPTVAAPAPDWSLHLLENEIAALVGATKLDLELALDERPEGHLAGRLVYDCDLFDPATAARLADGWARAVTAVAADPSLAVSHVPVAGGLEDVRRVAAFNATTVEVATGTVAERLRARADAERTVPPPDDAAVLNLAAGLGDLGLGPQDTVLALPSMLERAPAVTLWLPLLAGARVILADHEQEADGRRLSRVISRQGVTFLHATPERWQALIDTGLRAGRSLRALSGGAPLSRELADAILERCRALWNAYGDDVYRLAGRVEPDGPVTVGRPLANVRAEIVDRYGRPAPVGGWGELHLCGDATGDRARWRPDGTVELA